MLQADYTTTVDDYIAYGLHCIDRSAVARRHYLIGWLLLPIACLVGSLAAAANGPGEWAVILAVSGVAYAAIYPAVHRANIRKTLRSYAEGQGTRGTIGPIRLILDDEGLTEITETTRTVARWETMSHVEEVGDHTFIMVTGLSAAIVPRRGFADEESYNRVRDFAMARIGKDSGRRGGPGEGGR
ncbi:YcxB family protein [Tundrisphaera sp. TA3]|uniref:YcxB family protein n=1 Tax=Tundrisphaera sp. TA3 TaxID=3435775 RepID=UPI003EBC5909